MSDKGRKQEDRSGILKSVRGPGIPQLGGAPPGLIHHPPYPLPSDNPHTLSLHPSHLAYPMMRPALGMGGPLPMSAGIPTKSRGNPSISNDLGPPIFMPSLNLGVPKQPTGQPPSSAIPGPNPKPKNSIAFSQSTMSSNFVSDILSNTPAPPFMPAFHVTAATSILRPGGQPAVYIPHSAPHPSQNAAMRPSLQATSQSPAPITVAKPTPIAATNPQKPGPSKTVTKVVSGVQQKLPGASPSTVKQTLKSHASYPVPSQSHAHAGGGTPPSAIAMATKPPVTSMSKTVAASLPDGEQPHAAMGHMTYVTHAPIPHPHMVHTIPYMPHQGLVTHALPTPHSMGSQLSKMLLAPSQTTVRQPKSHVPPESPASHTHLPSPSTTKPTSLGGSMGGVAASLGSHNSAGPKVGTPEAYSSRSLAQTTTSLSTSGQPSSSASSTDTRLERPPQPSATVVPQSSAAVAGVCSNSTYNSAVPSKDRATCAEVASGIIITMPGLTGKHIAQITNSGSSGTPSPGSGPSSAQSVAGSNEGFRGHPLAMDAGPSVAQILPGNATHLGSPSLTGTPGGGSIGGGGQVLNLHQNPAGGFAQLPAAGGPAAPVAMAMHPQTPPVGGGGSPGQGNSSPRPRILRKQSYNRKIDGQATPTSPSSSSSPLINKMPLAGTQKHISGITPPTDHTHPMYNSTSSVGQKRPASPCSGSGSEGHNHLRAELGDIMASPRKKPRKQNVVANDDQYASNVPDGITTELLSGSPHPHPRVLGSAEEDHAPLLSMTTRSKTRAEEALLTKETPKEVEFRYLAQLRQSPYPINGVYRNYHRAAHNHFRRHADIKHREEEQVSAYNIASNRSSWQRASGWKLLRLSQQLEEMSKVEAEILETMQRVMGSVGGLDQCAACPVDSKCLANLEELVEGNVNRSSRVISHLTETNAAMLTVLDRKTHVIELLKKYSPPKKSVHSSYCAANSQKSRS